MSKFSKNDLAKLTEEAKEMFNEVPDGIFKILEIFDIDMGPGEEKEYVYILSPLDCFGTNVQKYCLQERYLEKAKTLEGGLFEAQNRICANNLTNDLTVSILGTTYTIIEKPLKDCDGYCDKTTKEIAVAVKDNDCDLGNFEEYRKKVLRHEIIHAYHHESGLDNNFENKPYGFSETLVDWFAIQSPKIFETFKELNIL